MDISNRKLKKRIIEISYQHNLSHLGSCLTAVDIIADIYSQMDIHNDKFILSSGHAGLAQYVVIEEHQGKNAEIIFEHHGVHPDRCKDCFIWASSGSLGHGLGIAVGMALANRKRNIFCLISDGECTEGSIWEALRVAQENRLENLHIYLNFNGWAAYKETNYIDFLGKLYGFYTINGGVNIRLTNVNFLPFLKDQDAHYHTMTQEEYQQAMEILKDEAIDEPMPW